MNRRSFFKVVTGFVAGVFATSVEGKKRSGTRYVCRPKSPPGPTEIPNMTMGTSSNNYSVWINVRAYGADPKGQVDSTKAIQAAVSRANHCGGIVYFPRGTYKIKSTFIV